MVQSTGSGARQYTYADLEAIPEDNKIREIIDGELFVTPSPVTRHQDVSGNLYVLLRRYANKSGGKVFYSPLDVFFTDSNVVEPDLLFICADHLERIGVKRMDGAPDLVVEISSPSTRRRDRMLKKQLYERFGVAEYWFVDLDADQIEAYSLSNGRYGSPDIKRPGQMLKPAVLPGLVVPVSEVFQT